MNFFDYIKNAAFFKPLTLKYRRIYYDCIQILIEKAKELPVLYESDARDSIMLYLRNTETNILFKDPAQALGEQHPNYGAGLGSDEQNNRSELMDKQNEMTVDGDAAADDQNAGLLPSDIISMFRECGWLLPREIGRNGEYVVNISVDCRRIMDFLRKMTEKTGEGMMSNRIFSMYEIVKSAFDEDSVRRERPYTNILVPLIDNETELKNELTDLKNSISSIMKAVIVFQDINSFGQFIMKDEMLDRFFSEYFFIKNNGLIPTQISFIKGKLRLLKQEEYSEKMITECAEKLQLDHDSAKGRVERYFAELQYFLSVEYDENMELIDSRINKYYNLANTRIMLMASNGVRLETLISGFLNNVSKLTEEEQDAAMEKLADCTQIISQKYIGYKSFEKNRRVKNEGENIGLMVETLSEDEKNAHTERIFNSSPNRYSVGRVSSFLDVQLGEENNMSIKEKQIRTKEEVLMYTAAMLYAENNEFPYEISLSDKMVRTPLADITDINIKKANKK